MAPLGLDRRQNTARILRALVRRIVEDLESGHDRVDPSAVATSALRGLDDRALDGQEGRAFRREIEDYVRELRSR